MLDLSYTPENKTRFSFIARVFDSCSLAQTLDQRELTKDQESYIYFIINLVFDDLKELLPEDYENFDNLLKQLKNYETDLAESINAKNKLIDFESTKGLANISNIKDKLNVTDPQKFFLRLLVGIITQKKC